MADIPLQRHVLSDGDVSVTILNLGCITQDWRVPVAGQAVPVVLGMQDPQDYLRHPGSMGVIAGRVANRIAGARFELDGELFTLEANEGAHHLHGGPGGLQKRLWAVETDGDRAIQLTHVSRDGDGGYPGTVGFTVRIGLSGHTLSYEMVARSDRPTPVNLAQHNYYNLMGRGDIAAHQLRIAADRYTPVDGDKIPTGEIADVAGTDLDFRDFRALGRAVLDHNLVLRDGAEPAAEVSAPTGLKLRLETDQPGVQLYTGAGLKPRGAPLEGQDHGAFAGLCLEPQVFPNAVNTPRFQVALATPERPYRQLTRVTIAPGDTPS